MDYETVMGLEVHVELATATKLFCACPAAFGAAANENVCPACAGMPGIPPLINKRAIELAIAAGLLTDSEIAAATAFDKKNYFYPDLPSGYQTTQVFAPICRNGTVTIETGQGTRKITLKQIHIEEDAGKLVHDARAGVTLIDLNRAQVPLIEIVSHPDFRHADEVVAYLNKLRSLFSFARISDCKMQEGQMRCDVNISVRPIGDGTMGVRTEIKNMNSLRAIVRAIAHESRRHIDILEGGGELVQETRRWDDAKGMTFPMRDKEDATDYRYFPHHELPPVAISREWVAEIRASLPESAAAKYARLTGGLGLGDYDSAIITGSRALATIFDEACAAYNKPKTVANWIIVELLSLAKGDNKGEDDIVIDGGKFAKLMAMVDAAVINRTIGKEVLARILDDDIDPEAYVAEQGLGNITGDGLVAGLVAEVIDEHVRSVREYLDGNEKAYGFLVGQVMKKAERRADPKTVNELLKMELQKLRDDEPVCGDSA